ncbi:Cse1-domain-containing protein [Blyttiomyces helicus]|uniref:Cse1-domain-containing protein n=1 Tax=Blyttiomyces helicus TaxID=388810 RepID=A0A4P9WJX9_9FUNG|nr:Cse1-domain-containing protein [Blyttiomyces helicus]|eukprot:RKO91450.1 Cse1-domain-containing protein [Blyttiomyces helicus]
MEGNLAALSQYLAQTMDRDPANRKQAEAALAGAETLPDFCSLCLTVIGNSTGQHHVRQAGSLYFKNYIKKNWKHQSEGSQDPIPAAARTLIKANIIAIMVSCPAQIQLQLSEVVSIIADSDFPDNWTSLCPDLISKLNVNDYVVNIGVLQTAHSIFKRWRHKFRSNALYLEIKFVMEQFAPSYLQFFIATDALIDQNVNNKAMLVQLFDALLLLTKIFYSFNSQDLPEFFEDNHAQFMALLHKYLVYTNPLLESEDEEQAGPLEKVKTSICESIEIYANRYEEEFPTLPQFVQTVWGLLTNTSNEPKNDMLVSKAMSILTSLVKIPRHRSMFADPATLTGICQNIVLPNMTLRQSDEESYEDEPIECIRRDLEGSDTETRRRAASDLVRGLLEQFAQEVTNIFAQYVQNYLKEYEADPQKNWKSKDTALYLVTSLSARALTSQAGATQTNEFISVIDIFNSHVLPELSNDVDGSVHPIIKVDAIKYLLVFRSQLTKAQLLNVFPSLLNHLSSTQYIVYTYAAVCIERFLAMTTPQKTMMFEKSDLVSISQGLIVRLFDLIGTGKTPEKLAENDYLMKTIMRSVFFFRETLLPYATDILRRMSLIIDAIGNNPSNPKFNHYAFEALAGLVRFLCESNKVLVNDFEVALFPHFEKILTLEVAEFMPYVFQILSQLLQLHAEPGIPPNFQSLLPHLTQAVLWESQGNIPALISLINVYLVKGGPYILEAGFLERILGVCNKLIASKSTDHYGFEVLRAVFEYIPTAGLQPYMKAILILLLTRLTNSKTEKYTEDFINFLAFLFVIKKDGFTIDSVIQCFDAIQGNPLFPNLLSGIIIPHLPLAIPDDSTHTLRAIGYTNLLTQSSEVLKPPCNSQW